MFRLIWLPNSTGLNCWVPRITCLQEINQSEVSIYHFQPIRSYYLPAAVLDTVSCNISELQVVSSSQNTLKYSEFRICKFEPIRNEYFIKSEASIYLNCPLSQLASIVLQLAGQTSSSLRVKLLPPVNLKWEVWNKFQFLQITHISAVSRVPLVESLEIDELNIVAWSLLNSVQLTPAHQADVVAQVPLPDK